MRQDEYGNSLFIPANTSLTSASAVSVTLTRPHIVVTWTLDNVDITLGTSDLIITNMEGIETVYPAGSYVYRVLQEGDITQSGNYKVTLEALIDGKLCIGATGCFTVTKKVDACSC